MEPESQPAVEKVPLAAPAPAANPANTLHHARPARQEGRDFDWVFIGPQGLRAGWSIVLFCAMYYFFRTVVGSLFLAAGLVSETSSDSAAVLLGERFPFLPCSALPR